MAEAARIFAICNACRYCEGYCAVFPAMERRMAFIGSDIHYLANLCHNCGECLHACQYAPPHEFAVDVPRTLAAVRQVSYERYAWPAGLARILAGGSIAAAMALFAAITVALFAACALLGVMPHFTVGRGDFYAVIPHGVMATGFGVAGVFVLVAATAGVVRFWRETGEPIPGPGQPRALGEALHDAFTLKYLHADGVGCPYPGERHSLARKRFHHLTFYGFLLCFAATVTGTVYHYAFGWPAPYPVTSLPVVLGIAGGLGLLAGPAGLAWIKFRHPTETPGAAPPVPSGFIALLMTTSATGLALLALRDTGAMGLLLVVHLGAVLALFVTLPYGRFMHGLYRLAALAKYALERRRPNLAVGGE